MQYFKQLFADIMADYISELTREEISNLIEIPPQKLQVDLAFPCFQLSKVRGQSAIQISNDLVKTIKTHKDYSIFSVGPYVNILFQPDFVFSHYKQNNSLITTIYRKENQAQTILIESPSPNTNKPLHLGHVRNMVLGNVLVRSLQAEGYRVKRVEVVNDRGIHICKSMLAYQKRGNNADPDKKSDHYVGDWYVRYAQELETNPNLEQEAQDMLRAWESGDEKIRDLWQKMNTWAKSGIHTTYERYHTYIDDSTLESDVYLQGKEVVDDGLQNKVFVRDPKGNVVFPDYQKNGDISYFVVQRSDGTTVYATQDLALIDTRYKKYQMQKMIYIVGSEQNLYFKTLFKVFEALDYPFAKNCHHLSYGMIELPSGKMKSRTGNVVDADELLDNLHHSSFQEIKSRYPDLDEKIAHERAEQIALGAINFYMIKIDPAKGFIFDPKESLSFDGETGPYLQYTYARIHSVLKKLATMGDHHDDFTTFHPDQDEEEQSVIKNLIFKATQFGDQIHSVNSEYRPNLLANYAIELAQMINSYYQHYHIVDEKNLERSLIRGEILTETQIILGKVMDLLDVAKIEVM